MPPKKSPAPQKTSAPVSQATALDFVGAITVPLAVGLYFLLLINPDWYWLLPLVVLLSLITFFTAVGGRGAAESRLARAAGFWRRCLAGFIDFLLIFAVMLLLMLIPTHIALSNGTYDAWLDPSYAASTAMFFFILAAHWIYIAGMESSVKQATIGKVICGIRVVDENGKRISFGQATYRYFAEFPSLFSFGLGYLMSLWSPKRAMFHDLVTRTTVVSDKKA